MTKIYNQRRAKTTPLQKRKLTLAQRLRNWTYRQTYAVGAVALLLVTTLHWAFLSAQVTMHNADQIIDPFLFQNSASFHGAVFPGAHTFLLKWPLFALISFFGTSPLSLTIATVLLSIVTVSLLAWIIYRIERRPLVFGTLCLALASVLLMIPTESYAGALLPVNLAMISTRNIEYILFIVALILIIRTPRLRHWKVALATLILTTLIASDKLFLAFTIGGAVVTLALSYIRRNHHERTFALRWLAVSAISFILATIGVWAASRLGILTIYQSSQTSPYAFIHTAKDVALGATYGVLGFFTNMGANPVSDIMVAKDIPIKLFERLVSFAMIASLVNICVTVVALVGAVFILHKKPHHNLKRIETPRILSIALIATTITSLILFVLSDHYYPADARYVSIAMFTCFIVIATYTSKRYYSSQQMLNYGIVISIFGICFGMVAGLQQASNSQRVYAQASRDESTIAATLQSHGVDVLIGDYWQVMPIKLHLTGQTVMPLGSCSDPATSLTSRAWQLDLHTHSFAYILSLKGTTTGFPACTINQVLELYGRPNSSQLISGTINDPEKVLLFYDKGINPALDSTKHPEVASSILPTPLSAYSQTNCSTGATIMNIVAHQDDDILFINPDTYHNLQAGKCVRTIYLTAGDAGESSVYWLGREEGSKAAYAKMLGLMNPEWVSLTISLNSHAYATISSIKGDQRVSLVFLHLPDGGVFGQGFPASHFESLSHLKNDRIPTIQSVDDQSSYTSDELKSSLVSLMTAFKPNEVNTLASRNLSYGYSDHPDHLATGWYAQAAFDRYHSEHPESSINPYIGYPIHALPINLDEEEISIKEAAFFAYADHDNGTCGNVDSCSSMSYIHYLERQYRDDTP